jgi:hypothetical protein
MSLVVEAYSHLADVGAHVLHCSGDSFRQDPGLRGEAPLEDLAGEWPVRRSVRLPPRRRTVTRVLKALAS